jgi:hypothetical protein
MIQPIDDTDLPTPEEMEAFRRHGLWFWDLYAGYHWSIDTAVEMLKGETIADPALLK